MCTTGRCRRKYSILLAGLLCASCWGQAAKAPTPAGPLEPERQKMLAAERQQKMLDDAQRLLDLAQRLKTSVDKTNKDELSVDVIRQAEQIEKLARQVREQMKQ